MYYSIIKDMFIVTCPHCQEFVQIAQVNCAVFRHGVYKDTFEQVSPHLSLNHCTELRSTGRVYGCCKPFKVVLKDGTYEAVVCDYI
jgi:hypothetical protein